MTKENTPEVKSLYKLYQQLGLTKEWSHAAVGFTIFNLKDVGFTLPYQSDSYRPDFFSFLFVKDGYGQYTIDEHNFKASPNTIYFTNPSNYRTFRWEKINEVYLITFDEAFLKEYISKDIFDEFPFLLTETISPRTADDDFYQSVEQVYRQIEQEYLLGTQNKFKIVGHLLAVLLYKIKEYFWTDYNPIYEGNRHSQIVISFKHLLEKHYHDLVDGKVDNVFRVKDYADAQGLHPNYLSSVIKTKTGKPITVWIADKTISVAKSLLQNSSLPIKEITYKLGFAEIAHFSNYFKKHTGSSPLKYRKDLK